MSYNITKQEYGRTKHSIDLPRFCADLAKALGRDATVINEEHGRVSISYGKFKINVDDGWRQSERGKAIISIWELNRVWLGSDEPSGEEYRFPSVRVSVDRPMEKIVADIVRRLIEPAGPVIAARKAHADKIANQRSNLASMADKLRRKFPNLTFKHDKDATYNGAFHRTYVHGQPERGPSVEGRFYNDGRVSIDRIDMLTAEQFERVMKALYSK